jgi:CubicO group peptidase (beta-lactamase class C family)
MAPLRRCTVALALLAMSTSVAGCARKPYLHWHGGDAFGVFEADGRSPRRIDCPGTTEERFACFTKMVPERIAGTSGALAVVTGDGTLLQVTTTEAGQPVPTTADTPFPLASVTKMFTAATAVQLAREGTLDLHRPIATSGR